MLNMSPPSALSIPRMSRVSIAIRGIHIKGPVSRLWHSGKSAGMTWGGAPVRSHHFLPSLASVKLNTRFYNSHTSNINRKSKFLPVNYGAGVLLLAVVAIAGGSFLRGPLHLEAPPSRLYPDANGRAESSETVVDPSTSIAFPKTIRFTSPDATPTLTLIGQGVRIVSFLRIQVYAIGFYADLDDVNLSKFSTPEQKIEHLIRTKTVAVRLVPTRNTSFQHLRDAYVRSLQGRLVLSRKREREALSEAEEEAIHPFIQQLKAMFPTTTLQKHTPMHLIVSAPSGDKQRRLSAPLLNGRLDCTWVGVELMRAYFEGDGPSPKMKQSVMQGIENLTS